MAIPPYGSFGWQLRELRTGRRLTIEDLADASDVGVVTISELELGKTRTPQRSTVQRLANALNLTPEERAGFEKASRLDAAVGGRKRAAPGTQAMDDTTAAARTAATAGQGAATRTLPYAIRSFLGREGELCELAAAATDDDRAGIYVLEGMPGVGKTALALHAAHQIAGSFPDGQLFIDLHGYTRGLRPLRSEEALRSLLHCLGMPNEVIPPKLDERAGVYRSLLAGTRTLIVLDNAASAGQVRPLLPGAVGCPVIITSRKSLRGLDDAVVLGLGTLPENDAIALFGSVAGPGRVRADDPDLGEIIRLCDRLPLAIRIIAAWSRRRAALGLADVLEELRDEHRRLAHLQDEDRGVRAAFELSYGRLFPAEQRMFRRLGLIPGPDFDVCAAESLVPGEDARRLVDSLFDHNLIMQRVPGRYRFHDLVRVYARSLAAGESVAVSGQLLDFYLFSVQASDLRFDRRSPAAGHAAVISAPPATPRLITTEQARAWVSSELANLDASVHYARRLGRPDYVVALSAALAQYFRAYGPWPQALAMHQVAYIAAREARDPAGQAAALVHMGVGQRQLGELGRAATTLTRAASCYRELGERGGLAAALVELGVVERLTGAASDGEKDLSEALKLYQALGDRHGEAGVRAELGALQRQMGKFEAAKESLQQALSLFRGLDVRYGEAITLAYLGGVQWTTGALDTAEECLTGALAIYRERGEPIGQANSLLFLGGVYRDAGLLEEATNVLAEAQTIYREVGYRRGRAGALAFLGSVCTLTGEYEQADRSLRQALELFHDVDDPGGEAETLNHYGALAATVGETGEARTRYTGALALARKISSIKDEADALDGIAGTHLSEGDVRQARICYEEALALYQRMGCDCDMQRVQQALGSLPDDSG